MGPLPLPSRAAAAAAAAAAAEVRGGVSRPWDRPGGLRNHKRAKRAAVGSGPAAAATSRDGLGGDSGVRLPSVPSVAVDGVEYYSDRFYLTSTEYDNIHQQLEGVAIHPNTSHPNEEACQHCGGGSTDDSVKRTPSSDCRSDLLDVSRLVASMDLKAALLATFSLDADWFMERFPSLACRVPTLVLHGQRNSMNANGSGTEEGGESDEDGSVQPLRGNLSGTADIDDDDDGACSVDSLNSEELFTQPEETLAYVRTMLDKGDDTSNACGSENAQERLAVSPHLHFTKVITKWVPPATGTGRQAGEFKAGVHHPKFLLLFERSGSLVVVVTTANLTPRRTIDGAWMQRFYPNSSRNAGTASIAPDSTAADFGRVLQNLLTAQTHAIQTHATNRGAVPMTPHAFCRKHLGWDNLDPISSAFDYSSAQVHLVATVPGSYRTPDYGRQRVSHILGLLAAGPSRERLARGTGNGRSWLPPGMLTDSDRLVMQPTSFGEWTETKLAEVLRSYLGESVPVGCSNLERLDIVWPSEKFVQSVRSKLKSLKSMIATLLPLQDSTMKHLHCRHGKDHRMSIESTTKSHHSVSAARHEAGPNHLHDATSKPSDKLRPLGMPHERRTRGGYMFLSSTTFNKIESSCLSRMVQWDPCHPVPTSRRPVLVSHLKTISRVIGPAPKHLGSKGHQRWHRSWGCEVDEVFSWVLMTSACLSRGAQGESLYRNSNSSCDETVSYANFELGVLFCSRLQHEPTDRVYCWNKRRCSCKANAGDTSKTSLHGNSRQTTRIVNGPQMISLPFPYRFDAARYQCVDDELEFAETPYFHEITPSDCHVGNMRMTPFGEYVAQKLDDE